MESRRAGVHSTLYNPRVGIKVLFVVKEIEGLTREIEAGETFSGKVVRIAPFGAFIELLPGKDGLLHISQVSTTRIEKVEDVLSMGDIVEVKVLEVDPQGKIRLVRTDLPDTGERRPAPERRDRDDRPRRRR